MESYFKFIESYLEENYPSLTMPFFDQDHIEFLGNLLSGGNLSREIKYIVDVGKKFILWVDGAEILGYSPAQWSFEKVTGELIPFGYQKLNRIQAEAAYQNYERHRICKYGIGFRLQKPTLVTHANGNIFQAFQESWVLIADKNSVPILSVTKLKLQDEWTIDEPPILMTPRLYHDNQRMKQYETILYTAISNNFWGILGLSQRELEICQYLSKGFTISDIAKEIDIPGTTIALANTKILATFRKNFSSTFIDAKQAMAFVNYLGISFPINRPFSTNIPN